MATESTTSDVKTNVWVSNSARMILSFVIKIALFLNYLLIVLLIGATYYLSQPVTTTSTLWIPKGSVTGIITHLNKNGYDLNKIDIYIMMRLGKPQSGWIDIGTTRLSRLDFIHRLVTAKASTRDITLIPGETSVIFFESIAGKFSLDPLKLQKEYEALSPYSEAGIFADTYHIPRGIDEKGLIKFLTGESEKRYKALSTELSGKYDPKEWNRTLTIASIIQKEAANNDEMPLVASVIYNRLKKNMRLQMDGTLNYGRYSHVKVTPERIKEDKTPFNTYRNRGIPPYPVCSVSVEAIRAAVAPVSSDYLYFMKNSGGTHDFTADYKSHRDNIRKARSSQQPAEVPPLKEEQPVAGK